MHPRTTKQFEARRQGGEEKIAPNQRQKRFSQVLLIGNDVYNAGFCRRKDGEKDWEEREEERQRVRGLPPSQCKKAHTKCRIVFLWEAERWPRFVGAFKAIFLAVGLRRKCEQASSVLNQEHTIG